MPREDALRGARSAEASGAAAREHAAAQGGAQEASGFWGRAQASEGAMIDLSRAGRAHAAGGCGGLDGSRPAMAAEARAGAASASQGAAVRQLRNRATTRALGSAATAGLSALSGGVAKAQSLAEESAPLQEAAQVQQEAQGGAAAARASSALRNASRSLAGSAVGAGRRAARASSARRAAEGRARVADGAGGGSRHAAAARASSRHAAVPGGEEALAPKAAKGAAALPSREAARHAASPRAAGDEAGRIADSLMRQVDPEGKLSPEAAKAARRALRKRAAKGGMESARAAAAEMSPRRLEALSDHPVTYDYGSVRAVWADGAKAYSADAPAVALKAARAVARAKAGGHAAASAAARGASMLSGGVAKANAIADESAPLQDGDGPGGMGPEQQAVRKAQARAKATSRAQARKAMRSAKEGMAGKAGGRKAAAAAKGKAGAAAKAAGRAKAAHRASAQVAVARKAVGKAGICLATKAFAGAKAAVAAAASALAGAAAPFAAAAVAVATAAALVASFFGASVASNQATSSVSVGQLSPIEAKIATVMRAKGYSDAAIAGVIGNAYQESGLDPSIGNGMGGAVGLFQFDPGGALPAYRAWCEENARELLSADAQLEYLFGRASDPDDVGHVSWGLGLAEGYYQGTGGVPADITAAGSLDELKAEADVERATFSWMACYERCANGDVAGWPNRLAHAQDVYRRLKASGGSGRWKLTELGQKVIDATYSVPSPGAGLCAWWVTDVYDTAGVGSWGGNACDMYYDWCSSEDKADLRPGMVVATAHSTSSGLGYTYGHVGVYIGDGKVRSNYGYIDEEDIDDWISWYGCHGTPVKWGWMGGVELTEDVSGAETVIEYARSQIGMPYNTEGSAACPGNEYLTTPCPGITCAGMHRSGEGTGFNCSGLVSWAFHMAGYVDVPINQGSVGAVSGSMLEIVKARNGGHLLPPEELQAGDVCFWGQAGDSYSTHVMIVTRPGYVIDSGWEGIVQERPFDSSITGGGSLVDFEDSQGS